MMQKICFFILLILSQFVIANAQNSIIAKPAPVDTTLNQGLDFANKLLPLTPKQLVNPLGVNSSIWGNANTAIVLPGQLGEFSKPVSGLPISQSLNQGALSAMGQQAQSECAAYIPTGDSNKDQYCAAVNFLSGFCIQPTTNQSAVLAISGSDSNKLNPSFKRNCIGSYGDGINSFGFNELLDPSTKNILTNNNLNISPFVSNSSRNECSESIDITPKSPVKTTNICWISTNTKIETCSPSLNVTVAENWSIPLESYTCVNGIYNGKNCDVTSSIASSSILNCPIGFLLSDGLCKQSQISPAIAEFSCPLNTKWSSILQNCQQEIISSSPATIDSRQCLNGSELISSNCVQTLNSIPLSSYFVCPDKQVLEGSICISVQDTTVFASQQLSCPLNQELVSERCVQTLSIPASPVYECPVGAVISGQTCNSTSSTAQVTELSCNGVGKLISYKPPSMPYQCYQVPSNFSCSFIASLYTLTLVNTDKSTGRTVCILGPVSNFICPENTILSSGTCIKTVQTIATIGSYLCAEGVLISNNCLITNLFIADTTYVCPINSSVNGSNSTNSNLTSLNGVYLCTSTQTIRTPALLTTTCMQGYSLTNNQCQMIVTTPALIKYICLFPSLLQGSECISQESTQIQALVSYICPSDQILKGSNCYNMVFRTPISELTCPLGSILTNAIDSTQPNCVVTIQIPVSISQYCSNSTTPHTKGCLQYSVSSFWSDACILFDQSPDLTQKY